jgi:hypothetical protein
MGFEDGFLKRRSIKLGALGNYRVFLQVSDILLWLVDGENANAFGKIFCIHILASRRWLL